MQHILTSKGYIYIVSDVLVCVCMHALTLGSFCKNVCGTAPGLADTSSGLDVYSAPETDSIRLTINDLFSVCNLCLWVSFVSVCLTLG